MAKPIAYLDHPRALDAKHPVGNGVPELNAISTALKPIGSTAFNTPVELDGATGAGKTAIARLLRREIEREAGIRTDYANCWRHHAGGAILYEILEGLGLAIGVTPGATPRSDVVRRLE